MYVFVHCLSSSSANTLPTSSNFTTISRYNNTQLHDATQQATTTRRTTVRCSTPCGLKVTLTPPRAQLTRAQLVYQLGGQQSTTPRPPAQPVPASTTPYIARRDIYNIAQSLPTSYAAHNGISSLGDLVIPSSLIPPGKTKFSLEEMTEIEKMLQDGTAFRLTSTTQEGRMAELKSGLRKMTGVQITDDMIEWCFISNFSTC